jgi:hypothetical protein
VTDGAVAGTAVQSQDIVIISGRTEVRGQLALMLLSLLNAFVFTDFVEISPAMQGSPTRKDRDLDTDDKLSATVKASNTAFTSRCSARKQLFIAPFIASYLS